MITIEQIDLEINALEREAPTFAIMEKLADLYIVRDHMISGVGQTVLINSGSKFSDAISGKNMQDVLAIMDELMSALVVLNPKLYECVMGKL